MAHRCVTPGIAAQRRSGFSRDVRQQNTSASSWIAGSRLCDSSSIPMTYSTAGDSPHSAVRPAAEHTAEQRSTGQRPRCCSCHCTWLTWSSLAITFSLTSGNSSFRSSRKVGSKCLMVAACSAVGGRRVEAAAAHALRAVQALSGYLAENWRQLHHNVCQRRPNILAGIPAQL